MTPKRRSRPPVPLKIDGAFVTGKRRGPKPAVLKVTVSPAEVLRRMFAAKPEKTRFTS